MDYASPLDWVIQSNASNHQVDCFMLYPTVYGGRDGMNMPVMEEALRKRAAASLNQMVGVFGETCRIFAPYYRQMAMEGLFLTDREQEVYLAIAQEDVRKAFLYYLKHHNQGRPFVLAGHSQGAHLLLLMMKALFKDPALSSNLVAAYLIGYAVTTDDVAECDWLKVANTAADVGTIITYNTQSATAVGSPILKPGACCVNPLLWTQSMAYAPRQLNKGAVFVSADGRLGEGVLGYTDARVSEQGALIVHPPDDAVLDVGLFPEGVYHRYDYAFFHVNLKENVLTRIRAFKAC